jgi:Mannose-6-phosphate isomerase
MPLGGDFSEIDEVELFALDQADATNGIREFPDAGQPELFVALGGEVSIESAQGRLTLRRKDWFVAPPGGVRIMSARWASPERYAPSAFYPCEVARIRGTWSELNSVTVFQFRPENPCELHFHDFDEYWLIFRGHAEAVIAGERVPVRPGFFHANPMGQEHGLPELSETVEGVCLSTGRRGRRRQGHLHLPEDA